MFKFFMEFFLASGAFSRFVLHLRAAHTVADVERTYTGDNRRADTMRSTRKYVFHTLPLFLL